MLKCQKLWEYAAFIELANQNPSSRYPLEWTVSDAINNCIRRDILKDVLVQSRNEVLDMFLTKYDKKLHLKNTFEEGYEAGLEEGYQAGLEEALAESENRILSLNRLLLQDNRLDDLRRASADKQYRETLYKEFKL